MTRAQLEHLLRAAYAITGADRWVVIGSQSILGPFPQPPHELTLSIDADVYSLRSEQDADLLDGTIGELSPFHQTFGYYAHGVSARTATLPPGWPDRVIPITSPQTGGATGLCLEPHDLAASKLAAGRPKDLDFLAAMLRHGLVDLATLRSRWNTLPLETSQRTLGLARIDRIATQTPSLRNPRS